MKRYFISNYYNYIYLQNICKQSLKITPSRGPYVTKHTGHSIGSEFGITSQFSKEINSSYLSIFTSTGVFLSSISYMYLSR